MKKKLFLVGLMALMVGIIVVSVSFAAPKYNLKLASVLPDSHPVQDALEFFAKKVAEKTDGSVKVTIFASGQLGQEKDYIEGAKFGTIELAKVSSGPLSQYAPRTQVMSLPFIWRDSAHQHSVLDGKIGETLMGDLEKSGFIGLAFFDAGFRSISNRIKPIRVPADLKGMKIRVMESKPLIDTINALGGSAVPMGQSDVYVALQQKVIDGWENNEPTVISFNMQEVSKYFSYTRHSSIPDVLIMSKTAYNKLPANIQQAIRAAAKESVPVYRKIWSNMIDDTVKQLKAKGMEFNEVETIKDFQKLAEPIYKQFEPVVGADLIKAIVDHK